MRLLLLGGTVFLGRHCSEAALRRGHQLTIFHRGIHGPELFPHAEHMLGDRAHGLGELAGRHWDAVIDTSGYIPHQVGAGLESIGARVGCYLFVSSINAYASMATPNQDEDAPLQQPVDGEPLDSERYGRLKVGCEDVVRQHFPGRCLIIRPGLISGPHEHDGSDRLLWWLRQASRRGRIVGAGCAHQPFQTIDARDLAEWMLLLVEHGQHGCFNAVSPERRLSMGSMLESCRALEGNAAPIVWLEDSFLVDHGVSGWSEIPLWLPDPSRGLVGKVQELALQHQGLMQIDGSRATAHGLVRRPLMETLRDLRQWDRERGEPALITGLEPRRIDELLSRWDARAGHASSG